MNRYAGRYILVLDRNRHRTSDALSALGSAIVSKHPDIDRDLVKGQWDALTDLNALIVAWCEKVGLPPRWEIVLPLFSYVLMASSRPDESSVAAKPEARNAIVDILGMTDAGFGDAVDAIDRFLRALDDGLLMGSSPPALSAPNRDHVKYSRRQELIGRAEALSANPLFETRDHFVLRAVRHWDARATLLRAAAGLKRHAEPAAGRKRVPRETLYTVAKWFVRIQYCGETPNSIASQEHITRQAVDTSIRNFSRLAGMALRPLRKTGRPKKTKSVSSTTLRLAPLQTTGRK
jgi:hypothetical protein